MAALRRLVGTVLLSELSDPCDYPYIDNDIVFRLLCRYSHHSTSLLGTARIENYVSDTVPQYSDLLFKAHFRMTRTSFQKLLEVLGPHTEVRTIPLEHRTLACLWYLGNQETFRGVADRFGLSKGSLHYYLGNFCRTVTGVNIQPAFMKWPNAESYPQISAGFEERAGFPGVIGAIDGTHIQIPAPGHNRDSYICRKGFPALHAQLVCDSNLQFIDVFCAYPGSVHDARVFKNSPLLTIIDSVPDKYHLIGDSAYPNFKGLLAPYRDNGHLLPEQKTYNYKHSSTRVDIERAIGLLKGKFRKLKYLDMKDVRKMPQVVVACCTLHNFIIQNESYENEDIDLLDIENKADENPVNVSDSQSGEHKRLMITQQLA